MLENINPTTTDSWKKLTNHYQEVKELHLKELFAEDKNREFFEESMVFLGDLYDPKNELYDLSDDDFDEDQMLNKKKDGARIIFEAVTIVKHILLNRKFDYCFLHGPIEATVMPFTVMGFPTFTKFAVENMLPFYNKNKLNAEARHFINVYLEALKYIKQSKFPVYGIVETSNSAPCMLA